MDIPLARKQHLDNLGALFNVSRKKWWFIKEWDRCYRKRIIKAMYENGKPFTLAGRY